MQMRKGMDREATEQKTTFENEEQTREKSERDQDILFDIHTKTECIFDVLSGMNDRLTGLCPDIQKHHLDEVIDSQIRAELDRTYLEMENISEISMRDYETFEQHKIQSIISEALNYSCRSFKEYLNNSGKEASKMNVPSDDIYTAFNQKND